jgi:hypothetical protein
MKSTPGVEPVIVTSGRRKNIERQKCSFASCEDLGVSAIFIKKYNLLKNVQSVTFWVDFTCPHLRIVFFLRGSAIPFPIGFYYRQVEIPLRLLSSFPHLITRTPEPIP